MPTADSRAEEWAQFRGPNGQGRSDARGLPLRFSETENVVWKTPIAGKGWSSPVILGNDIWMTTSIDSGKSLRAVCVDLNSGSIKHDVEAFAPKEPLAINEKNSHASPTPVVEQGRVYVHFGAMGTACVDAESGEVLWRNNEHVIDHKEGPGSSPVGFENLLIFNCDGQDKQYVVALHKKDGSLAWSTNRSAPLRAKIDFRKAYATPTIITVDGKHQQLVSTGADQVQGYDPRTGRELWQVRYVGFSNVPIPLFADGLVYLCTGYMTPELWAIKPDGSGNVTETHVVWKFKKQVPANSSPVYADGRIYFTSDKGVATCIDAKEGTQVWQQRLGDNYSASPLYADGRIYFCNEGGKVTIIEAGPKYKVLATNQLEGRFMASPAVHGKSLILRTDTHLYRIEESTAAVGQK
ncbi:MAG: PQQ-binding-like beta-propeller repeat protein [Planctomycetaceae bacterium]